MEKYADSYGPALRIIAYCKTVHLEATNEWCVKAYDQRGRRYADADYFTEDKADALSTMIAMLAGSFSFRRGIA